MTKKGLSKKVCVEIMIVILALTIRIAYCIHNAVHYRDTYKYVEIIKKWKASNSFDQEQSIMPLPEYLVKILSEIFNSNVAETGIIINMLASIGIIYVIMEIAFLLFKKTKAVLVCGLLAATQPALVEYSNEIIRENFFILFLSLSFLFFLRYCSKENMLLGGLSGGFTALCILCRIEGLELILIIGIFGLYMLKKKRLVFFSVYTTCLTASFVIMNALMSIPMKYYIHVITSKD